MEVIQLNVGETRPLDYITQQGTVSMKTMEKYCLTLFFPYVDFISRGDNISLPDMYHVYLPE